jgi:hypothetical protein
MSPKLAEFYRRAEEDPVFRDKKLKDLRSNRNVVLGFSLFLAAVGAAQGIYDGINGEGWLNLNELLGPLYLASGIWLRTIFTRRIAVLEAMNLRKAVTPRA